MIYEEYETIWGKIRRKEKEFFNFINKRDEVFAMTQPKSSPMDKEIVDGKNPVNAIEQYVIQTDYYDKKITQLNRTLDDLYQVLKRKREELRLSKNLYDRIYYYRYIERLGVFKIAKLVDYGERQTRRHLKKIEQNIRCPKMSEK